MINENRRSKKSWLLIPVLLSAVFMMTAAPDAAGQAADGVSPKNSRRRIVIDPGHGGHDSGVKGADGTMEKQVVFALAEALKGQMGPGYQVFLTRTGDYKLDIRERSSIANHHKADLLISLHAGASLRRALNRWTIYHSAAPRSDEEALPPQAPPFDWHRLQQPHLSASVDLAGCLKKRLEAAMGDQEVDIAPAPAAVLQGADLPAVLIETGYLTHPATARAMTQDAHILRTARAIADGIADYFEKN